MISYPLHFNFEGSATSGMQNAWKAKAGPNELPCAIPPEFGGPGNGFSPEDFFGLAVLNCFIATFKVIAEKSKLPFDGIGGKATLSVDRDSSGRPWMANMQIKIEIQPGSTNADKLLKTMQKAAENCMVANSLKTAVQFEFAVS